MTDPNPYWHDGEFKDAKGWNGGGEGFKFEIADVAGADPAMTSSRVLEAATYPADQGTMAVSMSYYPNGIIGGGDRESVIMSISRADWIRLIDRMIQIIPEEEDES